MIENTKFANTITPAIQDSYCGPAKCPSEILALIFSYLNYKDLDNASLVCREFKEMSQSQSIPKTWLKKLRNATAIVLGTDMRGKTHAYVDLESSSKFYCIETFQSYLLFVKEEIVWRAVQIWYRGISTHVYDVLSVGNPYSQKVKQKTLDRYTKITKSKDDCLIYTNEESKKINIKKFNTNFETPNKYYSFQKIAKSRCEVTSEGHLIIVEFFKDLLKITNHDFIDKTITHEIKFDSREAENVSIIELKFFSLKNENYLAAIYSLNRCVYLRIYSCKDNKFSQLTLSNKLFDKDINIIIKEGKMVIFTVETTNITQVIDLETLKVILSREDCYSILHQNNLISYNRNYHIKNDTIENDTIENDTIENDTIEINDAIEIYPLSSQLSTNPIIIPMNHLQNLKQFAVSDDLIAIIDKQDIKLFNLNSGAHVTTFSTAKIDNPGIPSSIYFEMKGIDSYLCVILDDTRVIYYSPKDFTKPIDAPTLSDQHI